MPLRLEAWSRRTSTKRGSRRDISGHGASSAEVSRVWQERRTGTRRRVVQLNALNSDLSPALDAPRQRVSDPLLTHAYFDTARMPSRAWLTGFRDATERTDGPARLRNPDGHLM